ncbi:phage gp6-like head-tail connector protein [Streptomyces carpaticus]|uniref:phage gp6-like head-tail connector protein n=1 Tax=Streptomyces carpaticus TaxID=285558 RepID=UPI0031F8A07D
MREDLNLQADDTTADRRLDAAIRGASRSVDLTCGRRFWLDPEPVARVINPRGRTWCDPDGDHLLVADIGDQEVTVATGPPGGPYSSPVPVEAEPTDALAQGAPVTSLLRIGGQWSGRVQITARWGWPAIPASVAAAARIQAARLYRRKDSPEGVTGSAEWGVVRLSRRDPDVWTLLEPYMLPGIA